MTVASDRDGSDGLQHCFSLALSCSVFISLQQRKSQPIVGFIFEFLKLLVDLEMKNVASGLLFRELNINVRPDFCNATL